MGSYVTRVGFFSNGLSYSCWGIDEKESEAHYLCYSPDLSAGRYRVHGNFFFELTSVGVINLLKFIRHSKWFAHLER